MLQTPLCRLLGIELPILSAPMGPDISGPDLVAAVSGAGGLGILQAQLHPPQLLREQIRAVREKTDKPFGVNFLLQFPSEEGVEICLEEKAPILHFFWGEAPPQLIEKIHAGGAKVLHQVGSVNAALQAVKAGVDAVVAQGWEAGGHVAGDVSTLCLIPRVVDAVGPAPVIAAGGIADGRGVAAVLALGAQAACMGTRFLASEEANSHDFYKEQLVRFSESQTVKTTLFGHGWPNAPHRTLRTPFVERWLPEEARGSQERPDEPQIGETRIAGQTIPMLRFMGFPPNREAGGDVASMSLLAGQGVGLIDEVKPAAEIVREIAQQAEAIINSRCGIVA